MASSPYNMITTLIIALLVAVEGSYAWTVRSRPYICHEFSVDIPVDNVTIIVPFLPEIESEYQATFYANLLTTPQDPNNPSTPQIDFTTLTKTFTIVGDYCTPIKPGPKANTLHLLTHGLGFNRSYWDFYPNANRSDTQYSYVHAATSAGYSTLSWNRLGIAPSTVANPYTEIQSTVELALLTSLTLLAHSGSPTLHLPTPPTHILHVGHSWGSVLSKSLGTHTPNLTSGIILTGFTDDQLGQSLFVAATTLQPATVSQPLRFPSEQYSNGFLTWPSASANQYAFLAYPYFDPLVLAQSEATKYPFALGEFLSATVIASPNSSTFSGPVYYVASELDLIFCASNCTGVVGVEVPATRDAWPEADLKVDVLEGFGHGLNLHYGAEKAYERILVWVGEKFE